MGFRPWSRLFLPTPLTIRCAGVMHAVSRGGLDKKKSFGIRRRPGPGSGWCMATTPCDQFSCVERQGIGGSAMMSPPAGFRRLLFRIKQSTIPMRELTSYNMSYRPASLRWSRPRPCRRERRADGSPWARSSHRASDRGSGPNRRLIRTASQHELGKAPEAVAITCFPSIPYARSGS